MNLPTLHTARLSLDAPGVMDISAIVVACQDPDIKRVISHPGSYTTGDAVNYLEGFVQNGLRTGNRQVWAIRKDGIFIGQLSLTREGPDARIGYWITPAWQGQGLLTEAATAVLNYFFHHTPNGSHILWYAYLFNAHSARVAAKLGFIPTGETTATALGWQLPGQVRIALLARDTLGQPQDWDNIR